MDNLCHTLTGACIAEAGLKHRTRFASAALMIASNLPDIDVLAFATSTPAVALRRGWTHGAVAQAVLPVLLTAGLLAFDRWRPSRQGREPARAGTLLLLGYIGVLLHVGMDWLNTYGVRLLMPFSDRWFYGDAVFIVDPWLWLTLAIGVILARRGRRIRFAAVAGLLAAIYVATMIGSARLARQRVQDAWTALEGGPPAQLMVGPVPLNPLRKSVIVDAGDHYRRGTFTWFPASLSLHPEPVPKNDQDPAVLAAQGHAAFKAVLVWSRFPYYELTRDPGGVRVMLADMRFGPRGMFVATTVIPNH